MTFQAYRKIAEANEDINAATLDQMEELWVAAKEIEKVL